MKSLGDSVQGVLAKIQQLKEQSKEYQSTLPKNIYNCNLCSDNGGYIIIKDDIEYYTECECFKSSRSDRLFKASQITFEFRKKTFSSWDSSWLDDEVRNARAASQDYACNFGDIKTRRNNSIALLGQSGAGKTHLLMAIANQLMDNGVQVFYFPFVEGFNDLKSDFDNLNNRIEKMQKAEVLFIDDLFKGRKDSTQFQVEQMFAVINYRYMNNLPMLISSEKLIEDLIQIDEALGSRIYEMSKDYVIELIGKKLNYRMRDDDERDT